MKKYSLISWNINGIRAVWKKNFPQWFKNTAPDILCLQETKAWPEQLTKEFLNVEGYHAFFSKPYKKGYSGVALYTKEEPISVKYGFNSEEYDTEGRVIIAEYPDFILYNIYFPNGKASAARLKYKMGFYECFLTHAENYRKSGKNVIVCGDVNTAHMPIDLARPKENETVSGFLPEERAWIDRFLTCGYLDTLRMFKSEPALYTWWDYKTRARERNIGWRIDYFYASESLKQNIVSAEILTDVYGSDHCPIAITVQI